MEILLKISFLNLKKQEISFFNDVLTIFDRMAFVF